MLFLYLLFSFLNPASICPTNDAEAHEFHISKCVIECNAEAKAIQVSLHIFIDDLEEALRQQGADKLFICTEKESKKAEKYLNRYLQRHFVLIVNNEQVAYEFIGKEISDDLAAVWCYLEFKDISAIKSIELKNDLLMEVYDDQRNIISLSANDREEYMMFDKGNATKTINF